MALTQMVPMTSPAYSRALQDFRRARTQAMLEEIGDRLRGQSQPLLAFHQVADQLRTKGQADRGLKTIPVSHIVGSVGRYTDFSRTFLPRQASDRERWAGVRAAAQTMSQLPPIQVYQIGDAYFVLDGNHRVSIARQQGLEYLEAHVTEVRTRVALAAGDSPDTLIIKAEYAAFLEFTRLDVLRPGADLITTAPGQYVHLENLIEVYRYFVEEAEERPLSDEEAVCCWYDEAYLPLVEVVRAHGILRFLPGRTETDLYVWIATHKLALQHELGWEVRSETAVNQIAQQLIQQPKSTWRQLARGVLEAFLPENPSLDPAEAQQKTARLIARYADRLFRDIMVPIGELGATAPNAMQFAAEIAVREEGQLVGLLCHSGQDEASKWAAQQRETFAALCHRAGVTGFLAVEDGALLDGVAKRAPLVDLVVLDRGYLVAADGSITTMGLALLPALQRPVLITPPTLPPLLRPLLAYDGRRRSEEGLFITAYLAERWGLAPVVVMVAESGRTRMETLDHARRYLEMHEVTATYVATEGQVAAAILETAVAHDAGFIILGGHGSRKANSRTPGHTARQLVANWERPLLLCP